MTNPCPFQSVSAARRPAYRLERFCGCVVGISILALTAWLFFPPENQIEIFTAAMAGTLHLAFRH